MGWHLDSEIWNKGGVSLDSQTSGLSGPHESQEPVFQARALHSMAGTEQQTLNPVFEFFRFSLHDVIAGKGTNVALTERNM